MAAKGIHMLTRSAIIAARLDTSSQSVARKRQRIGLLLVKGMASPREKAKEARQQELCQKRNLSQCQVPSCQDLSYVAASPLKQMILVDTGAGDHLFQANFDPAAKEAPGKGRQLMTVTGQDLCTESRKRSMLGVAGGGTLSIDYGVSNQVQFSILSVGTAASKGLWTVIGPNTQCMVAPQHAKELARAVERSTKLELEKKRGVYWLPVESGHAGRDVTMSCHGDDFLAEGEAAELDMLDEVMMRSFETKVLPRIGPHEFGGETDKGERLHRLITWSEKGFTWESDPKYAKDLISWAKLGDGKGIETPSSPDTGKGCREAESRRNKGLQKLDRDSHVSVTG